MHFCDHCKTQPKPPLAQSSSPLRTPLQLGTDYRLQPVKEMGPGGWFTATRHLTEAPANWDEEDVNAVLDLAEVSFNNSIKDLNIRGRVIRKKRSVGVVPNPNMEIPREALDETVLTLNDKLNQMSATGAAKGIDLPRCIFNGGTDAWCDVGTSYFVMQGKTTLNYVLAMRQMCVLFCFWWPGLLCSLPRTRDLLLNLAT